MNAAFHNLSGHALSEAPAIAVDAVVDSERASSIAKPQKAFAVAFAVLAAALAGCASGLGATQGPIARVAYVDEGKVIGQAIDESVGSQLAFAYTIRLATGELVSVAQTGEYAIPAGTPVLIEYGPRARVIPQQIS